jgi:hypothetical protein
LFLRFQDYHRFLAQNQYTFLYLAIGTPYLIMAGLIARYPTS